MSKELDLCTPIHTDSDKNTLTNTIQGIFSYAAMVNYPYSTNFLYTLPPNPVDYICTQVGNLSGLAALKTSAQIF